MIIEEPKLVGGLGEKVSNGGTQYYNQDRVYDSDGVAVAVATSFQPNYLVVAMRGRNPNNPSDRTPGIELEQRLEPNLEGICNTLTTVQKDNLVLEETIKIKQITKHSEIVKIEKVGQISNEGSQCGTVVSTEGLYPTISAGCHGYANPHILEKNGFYEQAIKTAEENNAQEGDIVDAFNQKVLKDGISPTITTRPEGKKTAILPVVERYRIRKLTPRECFRLMNVEEEQFNRAEKVVSNSQLYKVAGNAIVVSVLCALFSQLGIQGKKKWNEMTESERIALVHKNTVMGGK